ncbi:MAG: alpha/beta hydrolase family protein [Solirubrobacteraceae bacterium]
MERRETVEGIPVVVIVPDEPRGPLALWMSHLGGSKERAGAMLELLAARGMPAVSFDAPGHGERAEGDSWAFAARTLAAFRARMWPLLGETTLEALKVLDWAIAETGATSVIAGGDSMGGDVAVALAGIDPRVGRVAAIGSTPDWARPGMTVLDDPATVLEQGKPSSYGAWLRAELDPMLHVERYDRDVAIAFECGDEDSHVPPENAEAFAARVGDRVRVRRHPGLDHLGTVRSTAAHEGCADFFARCSD